MRLRERREGVEAWAQVAGPARVTGGYQWAPAREGVADYARVCGGMLAGLEGPAYWYALAIGLGDEQAQRLLKAWTWQQAAALAVAERWEIVRGEPRLERLAELVVEEVLSGQRSSGRARAGRVGVAWAWWWACWGLRAEQVTAALVTAIAPAAERLRRELG